APAVTVTPGTGTPVPPSTPQWANIVFAILQVVILLLVIGVIVVILLALGRLLARQWLQAADHVPGEEREALDGGALLRQQLRDLFGRRRAGAGGAPGAALARGGVRWLFREVLRAGAAAGVARRGDETADEYARRLAGLPGTPTAPAPDPADLSALAQAYDEARYDAHEAPSEERSQLGRLASQVAARLNHWARGH
ncbi:MAG TPA: DUF4129 domain-containing protein, partial [Ktedonobacterales bacterium]